jgi:hypothetical protein
MFAKIRLAGERKAMPSSVAPAHASDNAMTARRRRDPNLVCHWRPMIGGGFECYWDIELAEDAATEEPDQRWKWACRRSLPTLPRVQGRAGNVLAPARLPERAAG